MISSRSTRSRGKEKLETGLPIKTEEESVNIVNNSRRGKKRVKQPEEEEEEEEKSNIKEENALAVDPEHPVFSSNSSSSLSYDQQRQLNIRRNAEQMRLLQIPSLIPVKLDPSRRNNRPRSSSKPKKRELKEPMRRSLRSAGLTPEGGLAELKKEEPYRPIDTREYRKEGNLSFSAMKVTIRGRYTTETKEEDGEDEEEKKDLDEDEEGVVSLKAEKDDPLINQITDSFGALSTTKIKSASSVQFPRLTSDIVSTFSLEGVSSKMTKRRVSTLTFHPCSNENRSILLAGDRSGTVGILSYQFPTDVSTSPTLSLQPFTAPVEDFLFIPSSSDYHRLFICSQDGSLRYFDFEAELFGESYVNKNETGIMAMTCNQNGNIIYASDKKGGLLSLDAHSNSLQLINFKQLSNVKIGCVHLCPNNENILVTASNDRLMSLYDIRKLSKPIHAFQHGYAVTSAYWSKEGNYLASTCIDNFIRVWSIDNQPSSPELWSAPIKQRHDNHTGRWVTQFRAKWLTAEEGLVIGNMKRALDVFIFEEEEKKEEKEKEKGKERRESKKAKMENNGNGNGNSNANRSRSTNSGSNGNNLRKTLRTPSLTELRNVDMSAIPAAVAVHPTLPLIVGATASAYAYFWSA